MMVKLIVICVATLIFLTGSNMSLTCLDIMTTHKLCFGFFYLLVFSTFKIFISIYSL